MKNFKSIKTIKLLALFFISSLVLVSCSSDDDHGDEHEHEEELITTVIYTLTDGANTITLTFRDLDGEGGAAGTTDVSGTLIASTTYTGTIQLLNETENPAEDITEEVEEENDEHEFFYSNTAGLTINKTDADGDGNPVGIETSVTTGAAGAGSLTIILKHEPTKPNNGNVNDAGGSTDVEVTFSISVQ